MDASPPLYFGDDADAYFAFRPPYPGTLFDWLAGVAPARGLAWDCGTGSGQAALGLARHFDKVVATDPDRRQLARAPRRANIDYRLAAAEADVGLTEEVDLVACACSIHWFDLDGFYRVAARALKPGGIIAAWTYDWPWTGRAPLDAVLRQLKDDVLGPFWGENAALYFGGYRTLPFPFAERDAPLFEAPIAHSSADLKRFLATWSAVTKYRARRGADPLRLVERELDAAWRADPPALPLRAPLHMRCGAKPLLA